MPAPEMSGSFERPRQKFKLRIPPCAPEVVTPVTFTGAKSAVLFARRHVPGVRSVVRPFVR